MKAVIVKYIFYTDLCVQCKMTLFTKHCFHKPCDHNSFNGHVKVGLVLPGVSYIRCLCVQQWHAK